MAKNKRVKSDEQLIAIEDWEHADECVRTIGLIQSQIENSQAAATCPMGEARAPAAWASANPAAMAASTHRYSLSIFI